MDRRPIKSRSLRVFQVLGGKLAATAITPDQISLASIAVALAGASSLLWWPGPAGLAVAALCVQLRLLCNLLDGMVAVEGGRQSPVGALYNEIPDRISDSLFLVALGYCAHHAWLGWLCALAAALTAYIRVLGGALGLPQDFQGPQSKSQRMAVMTGGCVLGAAEAAYDGSTQVLTVTLLVIAAGAIYTCVRRARGYAAALRARPAA